ncbi:MAG: phosphate signaling complex protein PhoU [Actinobacteria bacterium]|nr:phosphate signaling complex protein PhoU [Planctomycetota bacterium]MBU4391062.1 phosphate signaling complex protein PhoU [Actinomycetota bacterium]MBU4401507.1 phosphate signaling complex protein PhoU [Actinomycetota bacterium]MBU4441292.1 phosphate signaling complex protein PhoU [Actinomycetota bacterium]MCG2818282.1 phosphate signaling complex protein PhoU [Actinomycetes bacterium]
MEGRKEFHEQLDDLYLELLRMANATLEVLERTKVAFRDGDIETAGRIIEGDDEIDQYVTRIDEGGMELLARQAPVAIDLRTIVVIMRMSQELERAADNCVNICKAIVNIRRYTLSPWIKENMDEMFRWAIKIMAKAIDAFKERDPDMVEKLVRMDDTVDRINREFLTTYDRESENETELVVRVVMTARFLERVADHAVNIGEEVYYMVTGEFAD